MIPVTEPSPQVNSSPPSGSTTSSDDTPANIIASCKRRISELEEEINQIHGIHEKNKV
jgi:hypothetical protein